MRLLLFSSSNKVINACKACLVSEMNIELVIIDIEQMPYIAFTNRHDIYVFDDDYMQHVDRRYLDVLKNIQAPIIVVIKELSSLKHYMAYNVVSYYVHKISKVRLLTCLLRLTRQDMKLKEYTDCGHELVMKNKKAINVIDFDQVLYIKKCDDIISVYTCEDVYTTENDFNSIIDHMAEHMYRVDEDLIINFNMVSHILKVHHRMYEIFFRFYEQSIIISEFIFKQEEKNAIKKLRQNYMINILSEIE